MAFDKALSLDSGLTAAWLGRGTVAFELSRFDEALSAYDRVLALKPDIADAWLGRGNVLRAIRHYAER